MLVFIKKSKKYIHCFGQAIFFMWLVLQVVALDGSDVQPIDVNAIILFAGETVDFLMDATHSEGLFWMRLRTLGVKHQLFGELDNNIYEGWAIIDYDSSTQEPLSTHFTCSDSKMCRIFNCPFPAFPPKDNKICISLDKARSALNAAELSDAYGLEEDSDNVIERFYNFNLVPTAVVNGHRFASPTAPLFQSITENITPCPTECGGNETCICTAMDNVPINAVVQFVFINTGFGIHTHHPIHLHGHDFAILKIGYPDYNETTGADLKQNEDIECDSRRICGRAQWRAGNTDHLNLINPPIKDTVIVPSRGYVVLRFKSTNPGFWLMHCHVSTHLFEGMSMLLNVGHSDHPNLPESFPTCGNFN